ncbi:MAG: hypothetical protein ABH851_00350 [Methanobacteriota archaeon]
MAGKTAKKTIKAPNKKTKAAKKCCKHCQDYKNCDDKGECCEYCDYYIKGKCTYTRAKKNKVSPQMVLDTSTSYAFDDFRGDNYGIDDYGEYEEFD